MIFLSDSNHLQKLTGLPVRTATTKVVKNNNDDLSMNIELLHNQHHRTISVINAWLWLTGKPEP
ncbi:hypothetical protein GZ77_15235 [Endozoicomonas montiporae]|uniref:Uncharacterized protein n=2 Tax=Endozoicomonas montiporae TaxID=1027273 RepID=A0A081N5D4_9GAMM|nr:hypothetical protein [Endozoicomonas montiporae]AMO57459.1 hypothetical protein EZMO1_3471 [Endozoicomonas montiporae CL-33]KEQ13657.1 hypothetical protein GZ77_15235 [Endozoicomonas montiporae]